MAFLLYKKQKQTTRARTITNVMAHMCVRVCVCACVRVRRSQITPGPATKRITRNARAAMHAPPATTHGRCWRKCARKFDRTFYFLLLSVRTAATDKYSNHESPGRRSAHRTFSVFANVSRRIFYLTQSRRACTIPVSKYNASNTNNKNAQ